MFKFLLPALVAGALGSAAVIVSPAPASAGEISAQALLAGLKRNGAPIEYARFRGGRRGFGHGRGFARGGYGGGRGYGYRRRGVGAGAVLGGLAAGALIGGALASQAAPAPAYGAGGDAVAYCQQRFRSYDPGSGTYLGNDGQRHPCP